MADHSYGGKVEVDWGGGFAEIAEVVSFTPPELSVTKAPGWHLQSPDAFKSKIPGMVDADDATMTLRFTHDQYEDFMDHLRDIGEWRITAADADTTVATFDGFMATVGGPDHQDDDTIMQSAAVCCNSIPVIS